MSSAPLQNVVECEWTILNGQNDIVSMKILPNNKLHHINFDELSFNNIDRKREMYNSYGYMAYDQSFATYRDMIAALFHTIPL